MAAYESWNPTSNKKLGFQTKITIAEKNKLLISIYLLPVNVDKDKKLNITTERTTEADKPVKQAYAQASTNA